MSNLGYFLGFCSSRLETLKVSTCLPIHPHVCPRLILLIASARKMKPFGFFNYKANLLVKIDTENQKKNHWNIFRDEL